MNSDRRRLERIVEVGEELLDTVEKHGITPEILASDTEIQWLVTTPLTQIGEQANRISEYVTDRYPEIPWWQIAGMRHRLVHDYEGTDWAIVCTAIFDKLPDFIDQVKIILEETE